MDFKQAIGETRKLYSGARRGDAAARCALNEIEHWFICKNGWGEVWPEPTWMRAYQRYLLDDLGNGPSRANSKLSVLRQVFKTGGLPFPDQHVKPLVRSKAPKWVLTVEQEAELLDWLGPSGKFMQDSRPPIDCALMADYIIFVVNSGLRVEEALRLTPALVHGTEIGKLSVEVPGTKTASSYDLLPLSTKAEGIVRKRMVLTDTFGLLFPVSYDELRHWWHFCREHLGLLDNPTATLKGLRRTFAHRHRHLPPDVLQRLMRHSNLQTTSDYLNVTGMNEDLRDWLDPSGRTIEGTAPHAMKPSTDHRVTELAKALAAAGFNAQDVTAALVAVCKVVL